MVRTSEVLYKRRVLRSKENVNEEIPRTKVRIILSALTNDLFYDSYFCFIKDFILI